MAVVIVNVDSTTFSINGINYLKNFTSVVSNDLVKILNVYDSKLVLQQNTNYANYTVDGGSFGSAALLQAALINVLYNRDNLGIELGYKIVNNLSDFDNLITGGTAGVWLILNTITLDANKTIPTGVTLEFRNTQINLGGFTLTGTDTKIHSGLVQIFDINGALNGTWGATEVYPEWFGATGGVIDSSSIITFTINSGLSNTIRFTGEYKISSAITLSSSNINLVGNKGAVLKLDNDLNNIINITQSISGISIQGIEFFGVVKVMVTVIDFGTYGIRGEVNVINFTLKDCVFHHLNAGIRLRGTNINVSNNLCYMNGYEAQSSDNSYDLTVSFGDTVTERNNFIISENTCLSYAVHRNIDIGELNSENNIIITNNICVSSNSDFTERTDLNTINKAHCIHVGYTGNVTVNKIAIISGNICKNSKWSGIYVRSNQSVEGNPDNNYIALISDNYIENIENPLGTHLGGIATELKMGSKIEGNTIINVETAINLGFIYEGGLAKVTGNTIEDCMTGIITDSFCREAEICSNTIIGFETGINLTGISQAINNEYFVKVSGNILKGKAGVSLNTGIRIFGVNTDNIEVSNNILIGIDTIGIAIDVSHFNKVAGYKIENNKIENFNIGFEGGIIDSHRNDKQHVKSNTVTNCNTGISIESNSVNNLFIIESNKFLGCVSNYSSQSFTKLIYNGIKKSDGTIEVYCEELFDFNHPSGYIVKAPVCFLYKKWIKGDIVYDNKDNIKFSKSKCITDSVRGTDNGLWSFTDLRFNPANKSQFENNGQILFSTTTNIIEYYNGTIWVAM